MYNAEKYIGECLDSILAQTFTDYEVIVVDDCSTDNSRAVVQSYLPKFNGGWVKLNLICSDKNSGGAGIPKNIGLKLSRGKYIFFIDSDDALTKSALAELYKIAEKFKADVVDCEKFYPVPNNLWKSKDKNPAVLNLQIKSHHVIAPTVIDKNIVSRLTDFCNRRFPYPLWTKLINRDFLARNNLEIINLNTSEDMLLTISMLCLAETYVLVPNTVNFYRLHDESISHKKLSVEKMLNRHLDALKKGIPYLENFFAYTDILIENQNLKFMIFDVLINESLFYLSNILSQIPVQLSNELIRRELDEVPDKTALTAFLFARMNIMNINLIRQNQIIQQLQAQLAAK